MKIKEHMTKKKRKTHKRIKVLKMKKKKKRKRKEMKNNKKVKMKTPQDMRQEHHLEESKETILKLKS